MKNKIPDVLIQKDGAVLVIVLLVLVATVLIGITVTRSAFFETKIAGNAIRNKQQFYQAESAINVALEDYVEAFTTLGISIGSTYTFAQVAPLSTILEGADVRITLESISKPLPGLGYDPSKFKMRRYTVIAARGNHTVEVGAYKVFPASQ